VPGQRWSPLRARLYYAGPPLAFGAAGLVAGLAQRDLRVAGIGAIAFAYGVRRLRLSLVLDTAHAVVRNPWRTYRVPYGDIERIEEDRLVVLGTEQRPWLSTPRLRLETVDDSISVEATGWLPAAERAAIRDALVQLARGGAAAALDADTRPPYDAVLRLLESADPNPALVGYADAADEIADYLRDGDPLAADEVADILGIEDAADLTRRLDELR
jgi:hypothetical protein